MRNLHWRNYAEILGTTLACIFSVYLIVLHMGLGRPIWLDEFLHFAMAADTSSAKAWELIRWTTLNINHNQTGIYMMLDYWLEGIAGASAAMLRLPSILCGFFFCFCAIKLFRQLRFSVGWTLLAFCALLGQQSTLYYIGEARPYFPLAAATVGTLVYYLAVPDDRHGITKAIGWISIVIGALFHPYFPAYWATIVAVTFLRDRIEGKGSFTFDEFVVHADMPLCTTGTLIFVLVAVNTWMRDSPKFQMDPFEMVRNPSIWINFSDYMHFQFVYPYLLQAVLVTAFAIGLVAFVPTQKRGSLKCLATPCLLISAVIGVSLILSAASYLKHYWILPRQWVASAAVLPLLVVWVWAEIGRVYSRIIPGAAVVIWLVAGFAVFGQAQRVNTILVANVANYAKAAPASKEGCDTMPAVPAPTDSDAPNKWVALANKNISCGGPVWPIFRKYYGNPPVE